MFVPINDTISFLIWLVGKRIPKPQSFLPVRSPFPQPSDATVRSLTPFYFTAFIKFIGIPQSPNPPAKTKSPSFIPSIAYKGDLHILAKFKNCLDISLESIFILNYRTN